MRVWYFILPTNLASVKIKNNVIIVATNQRSLVQSDLQDAAKQVASCFEQYELVETTFGNEYPGWEPNFDSKMVKKHGKNILFAIQRKAQSKNYSCRIGVWSCFEKISLFGHDFYPALLF